jgi:exonuclease SbcC
MIPVRLSIQGIYSYQTKQTIDFTQLTAAGIFGIFGPVGSGKSTILEAITFALYGRTDRLNLSGDNRNYNMMNLKSNELLIEFIFRTGTGNQEYMALVRSRRNSKQFEDVKTFERTAYKKTEGEWFPIEVDSLETIIGLSYDNFKRTVIIPQGKFQEFLLLGNKERTQMMKELFNLERYELFYKVASLESKANLQKQNIEGSLQQLGEITAEQITATEQKLVEIQSAIAGKVTELSSQQAEESLQRRIKDIASKITLYQQQLQTLKQKEAEITSLEKRLADFEFCLMNFKGLLNSIASVNENISHIKTNIANDESEFDKIKLQLRELEADFEGTRLAYDNREQLKQKAEELSKVANIIDLNDRHKNFLERISKGEKLVTETSEKIEGLKSCHEKLNATLNELKKQSPDMNRLSKAREWFTVNRMVQLTNNDIANEVSSLTKEIEVLLQQKVALFNSDIFVGVVATESYDKVIEFLNEKKQEHHRAIEVLNNERQHYQVQQKLEEYATALEDGKPCPLCGALEHPKRFNSQNLHKSIVKTRDEIAKHEKSIAALDAGLKKLTEINTAICLKEEVIGKVLKRQKEGAASQATHQEKFEWNEFKDEQELLLMFEKAENIRRDIEKNEKQLEILRGQIEKEGNQKEIYTKAISELQVNSNREAAAANTLRDQITMLDLDAYLKEKPEVLLSEKDKLLKQYQTVGEKYQHSLSRINILKKDHDTLSGRLDANRTTLEKELLNLASLSGQLEEQLKNSKYASIDEIKQVLSWNLDLDKERKVIASYFQERDFVEKQLAMLSKEADNKTFSEEVYAALLSSIASLTDEINRKNQEKGQLEANLSKLKADFETRRKLLETHASLELRLEDLRTMKQLFKGSGFVNYISSVYMHELIHSANERFYKLSGQKLSLEISDDNNFEVRDFMNGGKLRNVKTLSGGQTFQAALSLALALSDNTRKLSGADENFFFLDEGFGSLDKESLQVVFDTLKSLRHENRIVGIISHVEEMNQEIDIHLKVSNKEETGSVIEKSW